MTGEIPPGRDRSDAVILTYVPETRANRRERFEPRSDGGYMRYQEVYSVERGRWCEVGSEPVARVSIETPE